MSEAIGWLSSGILIVTLMAQVKKQWDTQTAKGVSSWLFLGQMAASAGFTVYSWTVHNWVFVVTNMLGLASAIAGAVMFYRNRQRDRIADGVARYRSTVTPFQNAT